MLRIGSYLLLVLAVCDLWHGSMSKDYVCIIDDPATNHCDNACLNEFRSLLDQVVKAQERHITCNADNETKEKLGRLEFQLQRVEAMLVWQQALLTKVEKSQAKLEGSLLEGQQAALTKIDNQLQAFLNKMETSQQAGNVPLSDLVTNSIPSRFEKIGTRYFRVVKELKTWDEAEKRCRDIGGYLATIRNEEELDAIAKKIDWFTGYWLGIRDLGTKGDFVSVASKKPQQFFAWVMNPLTVNDKADKCVKLQTKAMWIAYCTDTEYFICQTDNET